MARRMTTDDAAGRAERDAARDPWSPTLAGRAAEAHAAAGRDEESVAWGLLRHALAISGDPHEALAANDWLASMERVRRRLAASAPRTLEGIVEGLVSVSEARPISHESRGLWFANREESDTEPRLAAGDRIQMVEMPEDPDPVPPGTLGTVRHAVRVHRDEWQVPVAWDDGRSLMLALPPDMIRVVERAPAAWAGTFRGSTVVVETQRGTSGVEREVYAKVIFGVPALMRTRPGSGSDALSGTRGHVQIGFGQASRRSSHAEPGILALDTAAVTPITPSGLTLSSRIPSLAPAMGATPVEIDYGPRVLLILSTLFERLLGRMSAEDEEEVALPWQPKALDA